MASPMFWGVSYVTRQEDYIDAVFDAIISPYPAMTALDSFEFYIKFLSNY